MSFILDALKRAEQERNLGQAPTLNSVYAAPAGAENRGYRRWLLPVLIINAVILAYIAVYWLDREPLAATTTTEMRTEPVADAVSAEAAVRHQPVATTTAAVNQSQADTPTVSATVVELIPDQQPEPLPLRLLPTAYRQSLPVLNIDIHVYSAVAERRFVLINATRYQQGEWLAEGPLLELITTEGVILRYQGQRFKLIVQSSLSRSSAAEFKQ